MRNAYKIFVAKPGGKRPLGRLDTGVMIMLKWISRKEGGRVWTGLIWFKRDRCWLS
jgi:hypothetical protein